MFDVLFYVYGNYWNPQACLETPGLERTLSAAGFEADEIQHAVGWLQGLRPDREAPRDGGPPPPARWLQPAFTAPARDSVRVFTAEELRHLSPECIGLLRHLEGLGALPPHLRELVIDRAMATGDHGPDVQELCIIVLMVYWGTGFRPDTEGLAALGQSGLRQLAH